MLRLFGLVVATWLISAPAGAGFIYSQTPYQNEGRTSDFQGDRINQQADNFSLASPASVLSVFFWGIYNSGSPSDAFTVRFFNDNGGSPETNPFADFSGLSPTLRVDTGDTSLGGKPIYEYAVNLPSPVALMASTPYYLSIVNDTSLATLWAWSILDGTADDARWSRDADGVSWLGPQTADLSFKLSDTKVPAPAPLTLIALGVAVLASSVRRPKLAA